MITNRFFKKKCPERDSNSRPPDYSHLFQDYETDALTNCAIKALL